MFGYDLLCSLRVDVLCYRIETMIQEQRLRGVVFGYDLLCPVCVDVLCTEWKQ